MQFDIKRKYTTFNFFSINKFILFFPNWSIKNTVIVVFCETLFSLLSSLSLRTNRNELHHKRIAGIVKTASDRYLKKRLKDEILSAECNIFCWQCFDFDIGRYDNVEAWYNRCKQLLDKFGFEDVHSPGTKLFTELYRANLQESS